MATPCPSLDATSKLGSFEQFRSDLAPCATGARQVGKPLFFGRSPAPKDEPLYVAMDFEQYQIARKGMSIATTVAIVLGLALVVVVLKKKKAPGLF